MTTAIPSGLGATFGLTEEGTVGTYTTVDRWIPHTKADFSLKKKVVQSSPLRGKRFDLGSRRVITSYSADGSVEIDVTDRQLGLLFKHALGSTATATVVGVTSAYIQTHYPVKLEGLSLSVQKGIPQTDGTVQAFSYNGLKITEWTLAVETDKIATLTLSLDGWNEATATPYTAATYLTGVDSPNVLHFAEGSLKLGGTASTSDNVTTVASGAAPTGLVKSVSIKGTNKLATDRLTLGSTVKSEQLSNGFGEITGDIDIEFASLDDFYTAFAADTETALQFTLTGPTIDTGEHSFVDVILPSVRFEDGASPTEKGPDVISVKVPFTALANDAGDPIVQVQYQSLDTAV